MITRQPIRGLGSMRKVGPFQKIKTPLSGANSEDQTERGDHIHNWPAQQLDRDIAKNNATGRHYKRMVRALKRLENHLLTLGKIEELPSFLMECLVYNVPNELFNHSTYVADMRAVLATIFNATRSDEACKAWLEASERKYLFHASQGWTRQQAHALAHHAWEVMGFE